LQAREAGGEVDMTTPPPRIDEWREWLKVINREIVVLHLNRRFFREIMQMIRGNRTLPKNSVVYDWIIRQYIVSATMGVRRQVDTSRKVVSMARLLEQIARHATSITRNWYKAQYGELKAFADAAFDKFARPGASAVNPEVVRADLAELRSTTRNLLDWTNDYVAHLEENASRGQSNSRPSVTWKELDAAIDLLGELLKKYQLLLNQSSMVRVEPVIPPTWTKVFTVPWLPPAGGGKNR
jgi:hypothetical protein